MIIKRIQIKNFRSYYGEGNVIDFTDGLTLILGDNGGGKTTFFEALQWLLDTTTDTSSVEQVSEMCKSQMEIGDTEEVSVSMEFDHGGEKSITRSFSIERTDDGFKTTSATYVARESDGIERYAVDGKQLINRCYDAFMQRFTMFKGEAELDVFNDATALKDLVNTFSDIKKFDALVSRTSEFEGKAKRAYTSELRSDTRNQEAVQQLEREIDSCDKAISEQETKIKALNEGLQYYTSRIENIVNHQEAAEEYQKLKAQLDKKENECSQLKGRITAVNYNHALLDEQWILCAFPDVLQAFKRKCSEFSQAKRKEEREYECQKAKEAGKIEALEEVQATLDNGVAPLPWYLPNQETMEEMLNDHVCKVCGRAAEEGSEAYAFMHRKLEEYKKNIAQNLKKKTQNEGVEEEKLFKLKHIEKLHELSMQLGGQEESNISEMSSKIYERLQLVERLNNDLKRAEGEKDGLQEQINRLLIQNNTEEAALSKDFQDFRGLNEQKSQADTSLALLQKEHEDAVKRREELKAKLYGLKSENPQVERYRKIHEIVDRIANAFATAQKKNRRSFLQDMEQKANSYLSQLGANDFHGEIRLEQMTEETTRIRLYSTNGTEVTNPSGSQQTVMYISVLFAISEITNEKREETYPLVFDAPTSSFDEAKAKSFYNVINALRKQCIIVTKDFITETGDVNQSQIEELTCSVYRIKKADGLEPNNMATIRTTINKIK